MKKPAMVAALLAVGLCAYGPRATAQTWPDRGVEPRPDLQMRQLMPEMMSPDDETFVKDTAARDNAEVEMSRLAIAQSANPVVIELAQRVLSDVETQRDSLKTLANRWNVLAPLGADKYSKWVRDLSNKSGDDFDRSYRHDIHRLNLGNMSGFHNRSIFTDVDDVRDYVLKYQPAIRDLDKSVKETKGAV